MDPIRRNILINPIEELKGKYRRIASDLRNANGGQSSGPIEIDRPWDAYTDGHLGLMDYLGIDKFMVMGFCIGDPFNWNLLKRPAAGIRHPESRYPWPIDFRHGRSHRPQLWRIRNHGQQHVGSAFAIVVDAILNRPRQKLQVELAQVIAVL